MIHLARRCMALALTLLPALAACAGSGSLPDADSGSLAVVTAAAWRSSPDPIPRRRRHTPVRITIHHAGVTWKKEDDPHRKLTGLQSWGKREKGWPDVPYHFLVAPDGRIFEGRSLDYEGETNTEYDTNGHILVQLWGNFEEQRVSLDQLRSTVRLVAWLCIRFGISAAKIAAHRDWSTQTSCPGRDLYRYIPGGDLRRWVERTMEGNQPDVMLRPPLPGGPTEFVAVN